MKGYRRASAVIIGMVFLLAGILKLMDPVGTGLIVREYFSFFHAGFMNFSSGVLAFLLALVESVVGMSLITGVKRSLSAIASAVLLGLFTIVTLILWIVNPSMDCGCFGEAINLTHAQSFLKNVILCVLWVVAFVPFTDYGEPKKIKNATFALGCISVLAFGIFELYSLPLVDYTPMAPGAELFNPDEYDLPDAPVLSFSDENYEYRDSLALAENVMVISVYDEHSMSGKEWAAVGEFMREAESVGYSTLLLVSAEASDGRFFADPRTLMTLNRSNGGVTLISDGQIIRKWACNSLPSEDLLKEIITSDSTEVMIESSSKGTLKLQGFLLYVFAVILLI